MLKIFEPVKYSDEISRTRVGMRAIGCAALVAGSGLLSAAFGVAAMASMGPGQMVLATGLGGAAIAFASVAYCKAPRAKMHATQYLKMRKRGQTKVDQVYLPY